MELVVGTLTDQPRWTCSRTSSARPRSSSTRRPPCPPLFPESGGRHRQRTFRDFLADALPIPHGWLPTMRISDDEPQAVVAATDSG